MGAGNPKLQSYDEHLYSAKTYYIDFNASLGSDKMQLVREYVEDLEEDFNLLSMDRIEQIFHEIISNTIQDFNEMFCDEHFGYEQADKFDDDLDAAFRHGALIIAENDDALVCVASGSDSHHYGFGIVPKIKFDDVLEDCDENENKATLEYNKHIAEFQANNEKTMHSLFELYKDNMRVRCGAWTSTNIDYIEYQKSNKNYKFL